MHNIYLLRPTDGSHQAKRGAPISVDSIAKLLVKSGKFVIGDDCHLEHDLLFCYSNDEIALRVRNTARRLGVKIIYGLRDTWTSFAIADKMDGYLCSSNHVRQHYLGRFNYDCKVLPLPIIDNEVIVQEYEETRAVVMVNPIVDKGLYLTMTIASELFKLRRDIPIKIFESSGTIRDVIAAASKIGFVYDASMPLTVMPSTQLPKDIYKWAKIVIMPSLWDEPAGRVIAEAMVNDLPVIYSNRGGMDEVANGAGKMMLVASDLNKNRGYDTRQLREQAKPWVTEICKLWDDRGYYTIQVNKIKQAKAIYSEGTLINRYSSYFSAVIDGREELQ